MKLYIFSILVSWGCLACSKPNSIKQQKASLSTDAEFSVRPVVIDTSITLDYIMGKFDPAKDSNFVRIAAQYADREGRLLRKEAYVQFIKMHEAARKKGLLLKILSATRNFETQKSIWEAKWTGKRLHEGKENLAETTPDPVRRALKILKWSSMPGTSRHHWGTDIDLNNLNNDYFEKGEGLEIYNWLVKNAPNYGFCQPYSPKGTTRPHGYNEEKWHWSYLPLAKKLTDQARIRLKEELITGFKGAETAQPIGVVEKYILGISEDCL